MKKKWTKAQRVKFKATMAAKRRSVSKPEVERLAKLVNFVLNLTPEERGLVTHLIKAQIFE
jgi:hypothetical protein